LFGMAFAANTIELVGICRDFTPQTNPDFEKFLGDDRGICNSVLGPDGIPTLNGNHPTVTSLASFNQWYRDTSADMGPYNIPITLTQVSPNGPYYFENLAWFPLDNMGFGNYENTGHNFHFTCVFNTEFTYRAGAGQLFSFTGDDDVFVFINKMLAVDIGGVHPAESASVNLDNIAFSFGLLDGQAYSLDVFQNERHTVASAFAMTTDVVLSICGNGRIENGEDCDGGPCCSSCCKFLSPSTLCRPSFGPCDPAEYCTGNSSTCPSDCSGSFETPCSGLALPNGRFTDYQVIAFGSFTANTGDIEQRVAVGGNFNVGNGFSVGYDIDGNDEYVPYSVLVAGDASFASGTVYPDGTNFPIAVPEEDLFVGGTFTGPSYLASRVTSCTTPHCLDSYFFAARQCYLNYQNNFALQIDNVAIDIQWSGLYITCNSLTSNSYFLTLTASQMNSYTWVSITGCNSNAKWVINIVGNDDVSFTGASFPYNANQVLYNIQGSGRTITVGGTQVSGTILAPNNNINQPSGAIIGKVIANNINCLQINRISCCSTPCINNLG